MNLRIFLITILSLIFLNNAFGDFQPSKIDINQSFEALNHIKNKEWQKGLNHILQVKDPILQKILLTKYYIIPETQVDINQLKNFIIVNSDWPGIDEVRKKFEETSNFSNSKIEDIINWFKKYPPISSQGIKLLGEAKFRNHLINMKKGNNEDLKEKEEIRALISKAWIKSNFSVQEEINFLLKYNHLISQKDHISRIDRLLWDQQPKIAERVIHKVNRDYQKLFKARININNNPSDINKIIRTVPSHLRYEPGLIYDLIIWYQKKEYYSKANQLISRIPKNHPQVKSWWKVLARSVRELIETRDYKTAYNIIKHRGKLDSKDEPEAEWLAGWIAYSFLNKPQMAYEHFEKIYKISQFPINKARGAYWAAKAAYKMNKKDLAKEKFKIAAEYNFTFYGQLAALKIDKNSKIAFKNFPSYNQIDQKNFHKNHYAKAAYWAAHFDLKDEAKIYLLAALLKAKTHGEYFLIASMPKNMKQKWLSVQTAKILSFKNIIIPEFNYPRIDLIKQYTNNSIFAHAIIRQESIFDISAISSAGATGMMQIMPEVGKGLAKELKINFSYEKLLNDYEYNTKLGSFLLDKLLEQYNGSYILAAAAYNAGDNAVKRWIKKYGDPRLMTKTKDIINWIESIPYYETRNYVLRILENIQVYQEIMNDNKGLTINLKRDLKRKLNSNYLN